MGASNKNNKMQIITNRIGDFSEVTENQDSGFPQENILNIFKNQVSKGLLSSITYKLAVSATQLDETTKQGVYIGNSNALYYKVISKIGGATQQTIEGSFNNLVYIDSAITYSSDQYIDGGFVINSSGSLTINAGVTVHVAKATNQDKQVFIELESLLEAYTIEVTVETDESQVDCGIIRAGFIYEPFSPDWSLVEGERDLSIRRQQQSGAIYYKKRAKLRTLSGIFRTDKESQYKDKAYFDKQLSEPVAVKYHSLNLRGIIFGTMPTPTTITTTGLNYQNVAFKIEEGA
jgi:hypothetical protein